MHTKTIEEIQNELVKLVVIKSPNQTNIIQQTILQNIIELIMAFQKEKTFFNLVPIVDKCEEFFLSISTDTRKSWNAVLESSTLPSPLFNSSVYPIQLNQALLILALQKKAVFLLNLRNNLDSQLQSSELTPQKLALIRWNRIKNLLVQDDYPGSRKLHPKYWDEFWTHGFLSLKSWLLEEDNFCNKIVTFKELKEEMPVLGKWNKLNKIYFTSPDDYEVFIKDGLLFSNLSENIKLSSQNTNYDEAHIDDKELLLAISSDGRIFTSKSDENVGNGYNHSTFFSGKPGLFFGTIQVDQGKIISISNKTGHYRSTRNDLLKALRLLKTNGIDLNTFHVEISGEQGRRNAELFLNLRGFVLRNELRLFTASLGANLHKAIKNHDIKTVTQYFDNPELMKYLFINDSDGKNILQLAINAYTPLTPQTEVFSFIVKNLDKLHKFFYRFIDNDGCDSLYYLGDSSKVELKNIFESIYPRVSINCGNL